MYRIEIENEAGARLLLTQNEKMYQLVKAEGLMPPPADIVTTSITSMHGERFKSSRLEMRNIVLTIKVRGLVESNRIYLYNFFVAGQPCTIRYKNGVRDVYIRGFCENIEADLFEMGQTIQVSILCPEPFWVNSTPKIYDWMTVFPEFEFPFSIGSNGIEFSRFVYRQELDITNCGDMTVGFVLTVLADTGKITNPVLFDVGTSQFIKVNVNLDIGDRLIVNTIRGQRGAVLVKKSETRDVFHLIDHESTWIQLKRGVTRLAHNADLNPKNMDVWIEFNEMYQGV